MKITLTMAEVTALVASHYNLPRDISVEIEEYSGLTNPDAANLLTALQQNDCLTQGGLIRPEKKIASIKLLRDIYAQSKPTGGPICGLATAKYAIEEWDKFLPFVKRYGFSTIDNLPWRTA